MSGKTATDRGSGLVSRNFLEAEIRVSLSLLQLVRQSESGTVARLMICLVHQVLSEVGQQKLVFPAMQKPGWWAS